MTDMQTSLTLLIVQPSILNLVINFSTHLQQVKWKCPRWYLCLTLSIPSPPVLMQHMHQPIIKWYDPFHIIAWPYWFINLDLTYSSPLPWSMAPSLAQASPSHVIPRFKASDLPFTLTISPSSQASYWSSPPWSHDSMSCLICNELLHHHMITCGIISCVSHINTINLSCHLITKTKQGPLNCTKPSMCWQIPRVTSEPHSETQSSSATRWNYSSNALGLTPNLTKMMNQWCR